MNDVYGEFVGVDSLHIAKVLQNDSEGYVIESPRYFAPVGEAAGQAKENSKTSEYDNKMHRTYTIEGVTEVNLNVANIPADLWAEVNGKSFNNADGRVYDDGEPKKPEYALGFRYSIGDNDYRYQWFLSGKFSAGKEEAKSKGENIDIKTYQCMYTAIPTKRMFTYQVNGVTKITPIKRIFGDTTNDAFDETGWFGQVQTPDTSGAPDAIELSSIVPADDATSVAVDASIVITFNNSIKSDNINLVDTSTGEVIEASKNWDATRKILTMTPTSNMSNDTVHNVALFGVTDDYNQELAAVISEFETVAA